jgi:flagellar biosynthetic protein FliO
MNPYFRSILAKWKNASPRTRIGIGLLLFSLFATAAWMALSGSPAGEFISPAAAGSTVTLTGSEAIDPSPWYLFDVFFKLLIVIGLLVGCAVIYRHFAGRQVFGRAVRRMEVVETLRLGQRQALHLVRVGDRQLLIGSSDQALTLITEVEDSASLAALDHHREGMPTADQAVNFQTVLSSLITRQDSTR